MRDGGRGEGWREVVAYKYMYCTCTPVHVRIMNMFEFLLMS